MPGETSIKTKRLYKTWWRILILLFLWPFFLSYWIWKKTWNKKVKIVIISIIWIFVGFWSLVFSVGNDQKTRELWDETNLSPSLIAVATLPPVNLSPLPSIKPLPQPKKSSSLSISPSPIPSESPSPKPDYNEKLGNNWVAAKHAQQILDLANKIKTGIVSEANLRLHPENTGGKNEDNYIQTVDAATLALQVDSSFWSSLDDNTKKSLVTNFLKYPLGIFPCNIVGITIINTEETIVAKGTYDKLNDKVDLVLYKL